MFIQNSSIAIGTAIEATATENTEPESTINTEELDYPEEIKETNDTNEEGIESIETPSVTPAPSFLVDENDVEVDVPNDPKSTSTQREKLTKRPILPKKDNEQDKNNRVAVSKYSETYQLGRNKFKEVYSTEQLTYTDKNGKEKEIDNTLVTELNPRARTLGNNYFTNKANDFKVKIPQKIENGEKITISPIYNNGEGNAEEDKISITPNKGDYTNAVVEENAIRYNEVFENIDVQYTVNNTNLKEDIILNEKTDVEQFTYTLELRRKINSTFNKQCNLCI
jgi:hypothetical protein